MYRYIRCTYSIFSREITIHTDIYGAHIRFWPTLLMYYGKQLILVNLFSPSFGVRHCFIPQLRAEAADTHTYGHTLLPFLQTRCCSLPFLSNTHTHTHKHTRTHTHTHTHTHTYTHSTSPQIRATSPAPDAP